MTDATTTELRALLAYHEEAATVLRKVLTLRTVAAPTTPAPARETPRAHTAHDTPAAVDPATSRQRSLALLNLLDERTVTPLEQIRAAANGSGLRGLGALVRRGFIKRRRGGYIRTSKAFEAQ